MTRAAPALLALFCVVVLARAALADDRAPTSTTAPSATVPSVTAPPPAREDGLRAFVDVAKVLLSPRCANCHPADGVTPKVGDDAGAHPQDVTRGLEKLGMTCRSCHFSKANAASRAPGAPPAVPGWALPPAEHPMPFEGKPVRALCEQLRSPSDNGGRDGAALLHHVSHDPLVLYGWDPGGKRTTPPIAYDVFLARFGAWVAAAMPCP